MHGRFLSPNARAWRPKTHKRAPNKFGARESQACTLLWRHAFTKTFVFAVHTRTIDLRFQKSAFKSVFENFCFRGPPFLNTSLFDCFCVDGHIQTRFSEDALVWTGP